LTHDIRTCSGRYELETQWSTDDVVEQWKVLDEIDDARRRARAKAEADARNR
jgi:hypothetical protein